MATEELLRPEPDGKTPSERQQVLIDTLGSEVLNLCVQVAGRAMLLEARRSNRASMPEEVSDAAQDFRTWEAKLNGAVQKLINAHKEQIRLISQEMQT